MQTPHSRCVSYLSCRPIEVSMYGLARARIMSTVIWVIPRKGPATVRAIAITPIGWYHRAYYHLVCARFDLRAAMVLARACVGCELPAMIDLWRRLWRAEPSALFGVATLAAVSNTVCCDDYVDRYAPHRTNLN